MTSQLKLYFDGSCGPINPGGTAQWGFILLDEYDIEIKRAHGIVGSGQGMTNNMAEYHGIIKGLQFVKEHFPESSLTIYGDSLLVLNMVSRKWGWNKQRTQYAPHKGSPHLRPLLEQAIELLPENVSFDWLPSEENLADAPSREE